MSIRTDNNEFAPRENTFERIKNSKNFASFIDGITLSAVGILIIVIGMLYFTQVGVNTGMSIADVGYECAILYGATVAIYLLLRSFARRKGKSTQGYMAACEKVEKNCARILRENIAYKAIQYCREWEERELENTRSRLLAAVKITIDDFNKLYLKYTVGEIKKMHTELTKTELKAIRAAKRVKVLKFNENYLSVAYGSNRRRSPSQYMTTATMEKLTVVRVVITTAITSVFGVTLALQLIADFSFATVVMCLVKIMIIAISGVIGMAGGYNMTAVKAVDEMKYKAGEQEAFIRWCGLGDEPQA